MREGVDDSRIGSQEPIYQGVKMKIATKARCIECSRVFDLLDEEQAGEYYYGHDCEVE